VPIIRSQSPSSSESASVEDGAHSEKKSSTKSKKEPPKSRVLDGNWLSAYGEYTTESESPDAYHLWTGLSILASATRRNLWLNQGIYLLFPNLYVILVGPPGVAKSTTIRMGRNILLGADDVVFGPDSITREELIRVMAKSGEKDKQSAITIHSSELSSLIEPSGVKMIQFLTDIFDGLRAVGVIQSTTLFLTFLLERLPCGSQTVFPLPSSDMDLLAASSSYGETSLAISNHSQQNRTPS